MNSLNFLIEQIKTGNWEDRRMACRRLAVLGDAGAVHPLVYALDDQDASVREAAYAALGELNHPLAAGPMIEHLSKETEAKVRVAAIRALGRLRNPNAVPILARLLEDEDHNIRLAAAQSLGGIRDVRALDDLIGCLDDLNLYVRAAACQSMGQIENAGAVRPLVFMLGDVEPLVREKALEALDRLGENKLVEAYERAFFGNAPDLAPLRSLARQGDIRIVSPLLRRLEHPYTRTDRKDRLKDILEALLEAADAGKDLFFCTEHLTRFIAQDVVIDEAGRIAFWGCRTCGSTLHCIAAPVVVAAANLDMKAHWQFKNGVFRVNWFARNEVLFDFNRVEIGKADDKAVTQLCMLLHNDTDTGRPHQSEQMRCDVRAGASINSNTLQILRRTFGQVRVV